MNARDVPAHTFIESFLTAAGRVAIEATVIYTVEKNGKRKTVAMSNKGPEGLARAANALKIQEGGIESAAVMMHNFRVGEEGQIPPEMDVCYVCHLGTAWEALDDVDREGHRALVKVVLGAAMSSTATVPLVSV